MRNRGLLLLITLLLAAATACTDGSVVDTPTTQTITTNASQTTATDEGDAGETTTTLSSSVAEALSDTLAGVGVELFVDIADLVDFREFADVERITLFVPSDEAFSSVEIDEVLGIADDPEAAIEALKAHVVQGEVLTTDLSDGQVITTLWGDELEITIDGDTTMIGSARIIDSDLRFDAGVVHIIDDVLHLPEL